MALDPTNHVLQFFTYAHFPGHLQAVSAPFGDLAQKLAAELPGNPEKTVALRKLLEAKDAAVRAVLAKSEHEMVKVYACDPGGDPYPVGTCEVPK